MSYPDLKRLQTMLGNSVDQVNRRSIEHLIAGHPDTVCDKIWLDLISGDPDSLPINPEAASRRTAELKQALDTVAKAIAIGNLTSKQASLIKQIHKFIEHHNLHC